MNTKYKTKPGTNTKQIMKTIGTLYDEAVMFRIVILLRKLFVYGIDVSGSPWRYIMILKTLIKEINRKN